MNISKKASIAIICIFGFFLFFNSLFNGFVWDDEEQIVASPVIRTITNLPLFFKGGSFNTGGMGSLTGSYYRPMMTLVFSLIYSIFGPMAFSFHLVQVLIYISSAVILFLVLSKLFAQKQTTTSLLLSLVFLSHPFISETVFYAANMQDVLFFFFGITYFYIFISQRDSLKYKVSLFLLPLSALLSKETAILFGLISIFWAILFSKKQIINVISHWGLGTLIYVFMRLGIAKIPFAAHNINPSYELNFWERMGNIPMILFKSIQSIFFPTQNSLSINQQWVIGQINLSNFYLPMFFTAVIFVSLIIIGAKIKNKLYWLFFGWVLAGLMLHLQIIPLDTTFTGRFYYFAVAGFVGMIGTILTRTDLVNSLRWVLVAVIGVFSVITFMRSFDFRNGYSLYSHDIKYQPGNYNLENNFGVELYRIGELDAAAIHFEKSIKLNPVWWTAYNNLGAYKQGKGELVEAEMLYLASIQKGNYYLAYENYARILIIQKKYSQAKAFLENALKYFPLNPNLNQFYQLFKE